MGTRCFLADKSGTRGLQHPGQPDVPTPGLSCQPPVEAWRSPETLCDWAALEKKGQVRGVSGSDYAVLGAAPNSGNPKTTLTLISVSSCVALSLPHKV